jgi:hypothetical protein
LGVWRQNEEPRKLHIFKKMVEEKERQKAIDINGEELSQVS